MIKQNTKTVKEKVIQNKIIRFLEAHGGFVINPKTTTYSRKGSPDLIVCFKGLFLAIEVKRPGETPTELQLLKLEQIKNAGGIAIYTDNLEEVKELINDLSTVQCTSKHNQ